MTYRRRGAEADCQCVLYSIGIYICKESARPGDIVLDAMRKSFSSAAMYDTALCFTRSLMLILSEHANGAPRCLNESATSGRLVIVQKTSPEGCCTYGSGVFAPVGRGTRSSGSRSAMAPAYGRSPRCSLVARPPSAGKSSATRGSHPTRTGRTGHTGPNASKRARGPGATTSPGPRNARPDGAG